MSLLVDTWSDEVAVLASQGWVVTEYSRYDPTHAIGITPTGKAFTLSVVDGVCTVTIAGNVETRTESGGRTQWEPADLTRDLIERTYKQFHPRDR